MKKPRQVTGLYYSERLLLAKLSITPFYLIAVIYINKPANNLAVFLHQAG